LAFLLFNLADSLKTEWLAVFSTRLIVFQQGQESVRNNMTDFIIAVDDPVSWHRQNLQLNPKDYAGKIDFTVKVDVIAKFIDTFHNFLGLVFQRAVFKNRRMPQCLVPPVKKLLCSEINNLTRCWFFYRSKKSKRALDRKVTRLEASSLNMNTQWLI